MEMAGAVLMLMGSIIFLISSLGLVRMPDIYNRIQVGTKATTLGTIFTLIGLGLLNPTWSGKLVIIIFFIMLTNPISSHVIARAAHFSKAEKNNKTIKDAMDEQTEEEV